MADNVIVRVPEQQFIRGEDGYSPEVTIENIEHGHSVTITDRDHPTGQSFNVMDGDSAYEQAVAGGYTGTEAQFNEELASFKELSEQAANSAQQAASGAYTAQYYMNSAWNAVNSANLAKASAESAADQALIRMNSADASAQAVEDTSSFFTSTILPNAVSTVNNTRDQAVANVNVAKSTAVQNVQAEGATQISAVQTESTTQQAAIQQKGEDVLASIPADYTELTEDVSDLKSALELNYSRTNLVYEVVTGYYPLGSVGNRISFYESDSYGYAKVNVEGGEHYSIAYGGSDNFSYWCDDNDIVIHKGLSTVKDSTYTGNVYIAPTGATRLYLANAKGHTKNVVLQTTESIVNLTEADYPVGAIPELESVEIPLLLAGADKVNINDFVDNYIPANYKSIKDEIENLIELTQPTTKQGTFVTNADGSVTITTATQYYAVTWEFNSSSSKIVFEIKGTTTSSGAYNAVLQYKNSGGTWSNASTSHSLGTTFDVTETIDCANLAVYSDAVAFRVLLVRATSGVEASAIITEMKLFDGAGYRDISIYSPTFTDLLLNIQNAIGASDNPPISATVVGGISGGRYSLQIGANNALVAVPHAPTKALFVGNSLLLGIGNQFGMCASSNENDWAYYVEQAIHEKNANATINKAHGAAFEQLTPNDSFESYWNTDINIYTGAPISESFTADLDLVIIQLGDNVNTADRAEALTNNIGKFLTNIRTASPNARIIWVDGWFNYSTSHPIIAEACHDFALENITINDLNVTENQGYSGQTYVLDGQTYTVRDTWITHPGDAGMELIADRIINVLDM